jgi:predicted Zn-dependent protease
MLVAAGCAWGVLVVGCAAPSVVSREGMLWHRTHHFAVPDLAAEGWTPAHVDEADLAFRKAGEGVIAVRSECGDSRRSALSLTRSLWHRVPRESAELQERQVGSFEAVELTAQSEGTIVRTVVLRTDGCAIELIHVAPAGSPPSPTFDAFLEGLRAENGQ